MGNHILQCNTCHQKGFLNCEYDHFVDTKVDVVNLMHNLLQEYFMFVVWLYFVQKVDCLEVES